MGWCGVGWGGVGWGGDDDVPCTCTHLSCYVCVSATEIMVGCVGVGWGQVSSYRT